VKKSHLICAALTFASAGIVSFVYAGAGCSGIGIEQATAIVLTHTCTIPATQETCECVVYTVTSPSYEFCEGSGIVECSEYQSSVPFVLCTGGECVWSWQDGYHCGPMSCNDYPIYYFPPEFICS
jgi:hypothetical protein